MSVAREGAAAATAGLDLTRLDVEFAAANAYLDLATAKQLVMTAQANVERLQVFANSVHVLVDNQLRAGADAAQADAQLALARTQFIQAQTNAAVRAAVLADFLGIPSSAIDLDDMQLADSAPPEFADTPAITAHPEARQEAALVNQQQAELSALARSYAPQFNTQAALSGRGAGTSLGGVFPGGTNGLAPDTLNWGVGVQVTFPAFDIFSIHERKKVQQANVRAEQARYEQTVDDLSAQVQQAEAQLNGAQQIAENTPIELAAARESESQQRARFKSGLATVVDVAAAESLLVQAETDDAVAPNDLDIAEKTAQADQANVEALRNTAAAAQEGLRAVIQLESYLRVAAPFDGQITTRYVHPGTLIGPAAGTGAMTPIVRIETVTRHRLVVPVPENDVAGVPEGTQVSFTVPSFPGKTFTAPIARISHGVDVKTRTMPVELDVRDPKGELVPGTFCEVQWPVSRTYATLFVPATAVGSDLERTFVIRVRNGKTEWVDVKTGVRVENSIEIFGDLKEGDQIASRGTDQLRPGTAVSSRLSN